MRLARIGVIARHLCRGVSGVCGISLKPAGCKILLGSLAGKMQRKIKGNYIDDSLR
jgi:hypothetical protein